MDRELYRDAARALEAQWPTGRPSPRLTDPELIELRALWRECSLEDFVAGLRRLANEGRRLRPHVNELRAAAFTIRRERSMRGEDRPARRRAPEPIDVVAGRAQLASLRQKLAEMGARS